MKRPILYRKRLIPEECILLKDDELLYRDEKKIITRWNTLHPKKDLDHGFSCYFLDKGIKVSKFYKADGSLICWYCDIVSHSYDEATDTYIFTDLLADVLVYPDGRIKVVDLDENPPPDPNADDRNDGFTRPSVPSNAEVTSASWGVWRPWWREYWVWHSGDEDDDGYWCDHGWWEFDLDRCSASLTADMRITTDEKSPTATGRTMKSGYGFQEKVTTHVSTNQSSAVTSAQNAVTYFPEFQYERFWRLLERMNGGYDMTHEFKKNGYSTYERRTHFTPIWYPDGSYTPYTWLLDCWTPAGMLSMNLTDSITIDGNLWSDWHIAPQNPE